MAVPGDQLCPVQQRVGCVCTGSPRLGTHGEGGVPPAAVPHAGRVYAAPRESHSNNKLGVGRCQVHAFSRACKYPGTHREASALQT